MLRKHTADGFDGFATDSSNTQYMERPTQYLESSQCTAAAPTVQVGSKAVSTASHGHTWTNIFIEPASPRL